jgi:hypothetical protein
LYILASDGNLYKQTDTAEISLESIGLHGPSHTDGNDQVANATSLASGLMSAADKIKLDSVAGGNVTTPIRNETGGLLNKHCLVAVVGYSITDGIPLVDYADKDDPTLRPAIAMLLENVNNNTNSNALVVGTVTDIDTSIWSLTDQLVLGNNGSVSRPPPDVSPFTGEIQNIGSVSRVHASNGEVIIAIDGITPVTAEQIFSLGVLPELLNGWYDTDQYQLSFVDGTRTLTITAVSGTYKYYNLGLPYEDTSDSIQIDDVEGRHFIYFDGSVLSKIANPTAEQIRTIFRENIFTSVVYWDATNGKHLYLGYESHTLRLPAETHVHLHNSLGAQYRNGNDVTNVLADQSGALDTHAQFGLTAGSMFDEDVPTSSPAVGSTIGLPIYYLSGSEATPSVRQQINSGFSVFVTGTGRLAYNQLSGGTWSIQEVPNNNFVLCHVFSINDYDNSRKLVAFLGQEVYTTLTSARVGAEEEISSLRTGALISPEMVKLYTFIFQTANPYANSVKARIRTTDVGGDYIDWRSTKGEGGAGSALTPAFSDSDFKLYNAVDTTKISQFDLSVLTTSITRTITVPDKDITLGGPADQTPQDVTKESAAIGTSGDFAREDHKHDVSTATSGAATPGDTASEGIATSLARSDHQHGLPAFGAASGTFCEGNDPRLSDARTPLSHGPTHHLGGSDPVKLDDLDTPDDNTDLDASISRHGLMRKLSNNSSQYLNGIGNWSTPPPTTYTVAGFTELAAISSPSPGETCYISGYWKIFHRGLDAWVSPEAIGAVNNSGGTLAWGDVVVVDSSGGIDAVTTTNSLGNIDVMGIVVLGGAQGATVTVAVSGRVWQVNVIGAVVKGDFIRTSTTAKVGVATSVGAPGVFAQATQSKGSGTGLVRCWLCPKEVY